MNRFLFNSQGKGEFYYKLILAQSDKDTFSRIIENESLPLSGSSSLIKNYQYFKDKIDECWNCTDFLCKGIAKLTIMDISTDRVYENPKTIYESINSTGLDKIQAGLIRNWLALLRSKS